MNTVHQALSLIEWYKDAGIQTFCTEEARNFFQPPPVSVQEKALPSSSSLTSALSSSLSAAAATPLPAGAAKLPESFAAAFQQARSSAEQATTLAELEDAIRRFDGCSLKRTATNTVIRDGSATGPLMVIGEAPGEQEDRQGIPFCGPSGQLLDKMFAAIGLDRSSICITNPVYWRPPGNRQPHTEELELCQPFMERMIALVQPKVLILSGSVALKHVLKQTQGITRLRGKIYEYQNRYLQNPLPTFVFFHPSYLIRQPEQKRLAWHDLLILKKYINNIGL
jgi:DNA polymerase